MSSVIARTILFCAVLCCFAGVAFGEGSYQKTKDGKTTVWNDHPKAGDVATWAGGRDREGYATGFGTLTWYRVHQDKSVMYARYFGNMTKGKFDGAVNAHSKGKTAHALFTDGTRTSPWAMGAAPSRGLATERSAETKPRAEQPSEPTETPRPTPPRLVPKPQPAMQKPATTLTPPPVEPSPSAPVEPEHQPEPTAGEPESTPSPSPATPTPSPIPTPSPTPKPTPTATPTPTPSPKPTPTPTPKPTPTPTATPTPTPKPTATPTATPTPTPRPTPTPTPTATPTPRPTPKPTSTPSPSATRSRRPIPKPAKGKPKPGVDEALRSLVGPPSSLRATPPSEPSATAATSDGAPPTNSNPPLSKEEVIDLADTVARVHGYNLGDYKRPEAQYHQEDDSWSLFYDQAPSDGIPEAGKHFNVTVDNKTKKAAIVPGE